MQKTMSEDSFYARMCAGVSSGRVTFREGRKRFLGEFKSGHVRRLVVRVGHYSRKIRHVKYYQGVWVNGQWIFRQCGQPDYRQWSPDIPSELTPLVIAKLSRRIDQREAATKQ
jgi:hypothetical protein